MRLLKSYLDRRRVGSGVGRVKRRKVGDDANVGHHHFEVAWIHNLANQVLNLGDVLFRNFNASSGRHLEIDSELAGIGLREKGEPEKGINTQAE